MSIGPMLLKIALGFAIVVLLGWLLFRRMGADWFGSHSRICPSAVLNIF
jgi:hypothetical protein